MRQEYKCGLCSALIWGSGQTLNRQWVKAGSFFAIRLVIIFNEFYTGYYWEYLTNQIDGAFEWGLYGGFFGKGFWGLFTLGENARIITEDGITKGDHSIILLIQGAYTLVVFILCSLIYWGNIKDSYTVRKKIRLGEDVSYGFSKLRLQKYIEKQYPYAVSAPALLGVSIFVVIPILFSFFTAFTNYNVYHIPPTKLVDWVGFKNFVDIFRIPIWSSTFLGVLIWNVIFALVLTFGTAAIGLLQAMIINHKSIIFPKMWRSLLILPWAVPGLISLLIFRVLFNGQFGPINDYLLSLGLITERIPWFTNPSFARSMVFLVSFWLGFPYWMVLCSGVLAGVDKSMNESAVIDVASSRQAFWYITFPQLLSAIAPLLILTFAGNFNNFGLIYFLTDGGPANVNYQFAGHTDILISWIYKLTLDQRMYNMASVMSILIFLFIAPMAAYNLTRTNAFKGETA